MSEFGEQRAVSPAAWKSGLALAAVAAMCTTLVAITFYFIDADRTPTLPYAADRYRPRAEYYADGIRDFL